MDLKKILKTIKLHEQEISVFFGVIILLIAFVFILRYVRNLKNAIDNPQQTAQTQTNQGQTHTVVKGETLWSIAQKYLNNGNLYKKIAEANNISDPSKLEVGQKLTIPETQATPVPQITETAAATVNTATPAPKPVTTTTTVTKTTESKYTVVRGDSLWKIAVKEYGNGFAWVKIARANNLKNPNLIHAGNVFILPR